MSNLDMGKIINRAIFHQEKLEGLLRRIRAYDDAITLVRQAIEQLRLDPETDMIHIYFMQARTMLMNEFMDIFLGEEQDLV